MLVIESEGGEPAKNKEHARYQSIGGITNHMAQWTRIDLQNAQRKVCQFLDKPTKECLEYQDRLTNFSVFTENHRHTILPDNVKKCISSRFMAKAIQNTQRIHHNKASTADTLTYLNRALICMLSKMMLVVALSTTKA